MIGSSENRISYNGNGIATEFAYTFKILEKSDIKVLHVANDGTEELLTTDYYVDMDKSVVIYPGYAPGEEIPEQNRPPILSEGEMLVLYREVPITQESALDKHWPFNVIENGLDKLTIICQQIWDRLQRSFYVSESTRSTFDPKVPIEAGKTFRVKDDGSGFEVTEDPAKVLPLAQGVYAQTKEQAEFAKEQADASSEAASAAKTSETNAKSSEESAASSASTAIEKADIATTKASAASSSASAAKTSETNAKSSETNAASSASIATAKADIAITKASEAFASASAAKTSETNAKSSEESAASSASTATSEANRSKEEADRSYYYPLTTIIGKTPNYYKRPSIPTPNKTKITVPANTQVNIGNKGYVSTQDTVLELSSVGTADVRKGKDVYIYACQPADTNSTVPVFVLSMNSTVPDGYTADNSRKIGGFHCLCAAIGNISGHSLSGYAAGDIIPSSVWDLYWRATSQNEGMSYDDGVGFWVDIYLPSWDGNKLVSVYGGVIVDGYSAKAMHGELFVEEAGRVGKFLIDRAEFMVITRGTPQKTNISGSADPNTTGGHVDTNGVRIVSNSGIEDLCGVMWQWTRDIMGIENANSNAERTTGFLGAAEQTTSAEGDHWRYGLQWQEDGRGTANINIDGSTNVRGVAYGGLVRAIVGCRWGNGLHGGGRSVNWNGLSSNRDSSISARCGSMPRVVNAA